MASNEKQPVVNPYKRKDKPENERIVPTEKQQITYHLRQVPEIEKPTDTSLKSSTKVHPIQSYLREFTKGLPRVDDTGLPYMPDNRVMLKDRKYLDSKSKLDNVLPPNPHYIPEPRDRALRHKPTNMFWDEATMKKARDEFYVPAGTKVIIMAPEVFDRPSMRLDPKFRTNKGGVMVPCPYCKCNNFVSIVRYTTVQDKCIRVLNESNKQDIVIGAVYGCHRFDMYNPNESCARKTDDDKGQGRTYPKTFTVYTKDVWKQYPDAIKNKYLDYLNDIEDKSTHLYLSPMFADNLLFNERNFDALEKEMANAQERHGDLLQTSYNRFTQEQKLMVPIQPKSMTDSQYEIHKEMKWPAMKGREVLNEYFKPPSADTLIKMFELLFVKILPHLLRYFYSIYGGRFVRVDGTHNIMKKTMNLKEAGKENNCLVKIMGEYGHLLSYAFCEAEDRQVIERLLFCLRKRYERLGGMVLVRRVIAGYSDTCCGGGDPKKHYLPMIFPGCKRAFLKDVWHGNETVLRCCYGFGHPLHDGFAGQLWSHMLKHDQRSLEDALEHFRTKDEEGKKIRDRELAVQEMMKRDDYKRRIYNYISHKDIKKTAEKVDQLRKVTREMDNELKREAESEGKAYIRYFKKSVPSMDIMGTDDAIDNLIKHIEKGCFVDPLVPRSMSYEETGKKPKDGGPKYLKRRRGTNVIEINNKHSKHFVVGNVARQRSSLSDKKMLLFAVEHNLGCDQRIEHLTNKKALPRHWFLLEALQKEMEFTTRTVFDEDYEYPPELDLKLHQEPIGELYQMEQEWEKHDAELRKLCQQAEKDLNGIMGYLVPTTGNEEESMTINHREDEEFPPPEAAASPAPSADERPASSSAQRSYSEVAQLPPMAMDQAAFSERAVAFQQGQSPARKKSKQSTNFFGNERYGVRKSGGDTTGINRRYIHRLNQTHKQHLDRLYYEIMKECNNNIGTDALSETLASRFNYWHNYWIAHGYPAGYGGMVTAKVVKQHLRERGNQAVGLQMQQRMQEPMPTVHKPTVYKPPPGSHKELTPMTEGDVDALGYRPCRKVLGLFSRSERRGHLANLSTSQNGSHEELKHRIKKLYGMH